MLMMVESRDVPYLCYLKLYLLTREREKWTLEVEMRMRESTSHARDA